MKQLRWISGWIGVLVGGGHWVLASSPGGVPSLTPAQGAIDQAAAIKDPELRRDQLKQAIREGLFSLNKDVRDAVFHYLVANSRWIDLGPFSDVIEEFATSDPHCRGMGLLDDNERARAPLEVRRQIYREAIESGTARLRRGSPLTRASAIILAAFEGMSDLRPLIDKYVPLVEEGWKESFQFHSIPALLELTGNATDLDAAADQAATRLLAMPDEVLRTRMDTDEGFQAAVIRMTEYLCAKDPFSDRASPGCEKLKDVVQRQMLLQQEKRFPPELGKAEIQWLERWRERLR